MKAHYLSVSFLLVMLLVGCTASGPQYRAAHTNDPHKANFYIYREKAFIGSAASFDVYVDNQKLGTLSNAGYLYTPVSAGDHTLKVVFWHDWIAGDKADVKNFNVSAGKSYYIKISGRMADKDRMMSMSSGMPVMVPDFTYDLISVSPTQAQQELQPLRLSQ